MSTRVITTCKGCVCTASALVLMVVLSISIVIPDTAAADRATERQSSHSAKMATHKEPSTTARSRQATPVITGPACTENCQIFDIYGNPHLPPPTPSVASPIGTTYSVHHLVGADINGDQVPECFFIDEDPPPDAPDDIVLFDGVPENIRTDVLGTVPTVVEASTDNGDGTHTLVIDTRSPQGTGLFPGGLTDSNSGTPLVDACFLLGIDDTLNWAGMDTVTDAFITFFSDDQTVIGPLDVTGPPYFQDPWNGIFGITIAGAAGTGINGVRLEIRVAKIPAQTVGACCLDGLCVADVEESSCQNLDGAWTFGASCGANPSLPPPVCERITCGFNNGLPLDDRGAPPSRFAPDVRIASGAADDFVLPDGQNDGCRITLVRAWATHQTDEEPTVDPAVDYQGVNVTVYLDVASRRPGGRPMNDGTHLATTSGGIVYTQTISMDEIVVANEAPSCLSDIWRLDIPVELLLHEGVRYWIEVQPIMDASLGEAHVVLSQNNNDNPAQQAFADWQPIVGNVDHCPGGDPPTPPPGTRRNLAFRLFGEAMTMPLNDSCLAAIPVTDGVVPFSTAGSTTDGRDEPDGCDFFDYTHVESDIWYEYVSSCTGQLTVDLCDSDYDTKFAVYDDCIACPPRSTALVACDEDGCPGTVQSIVEFPVAKESCYAIRIGGFIGAQGEGSMDISCEPTQPILGACCSEGYCLGTVTEEECAAPGEVWFIDENCATFVCPAPHPPNDECIDCIPLTTEVPYEARTNGATGQDESSCGLRDRLDVWHCWTADCTGVARFSLCDSLFDTTMAVYDACDGTELACADDDCHFQSELDLPVIAGETYYVRVSGHDGAFGTYNLVVEPCRNACCFPQGGCAMGTLAQCDSVNGQYFPGWTCRDVDPPNGVPDACEQPIEEWYWKDYNGEAPGGLMSDYDQNNDYDNADGDDDPTSGIDPSYCGPTAAANSLWWFHHKFPDAGVVPPEYTHTDLVENLAARMGTNGTPGHPSPSGHEGPYVGTFPDDLEMGIVTYLTEHELTDLFYQHTVIEPSYGLVVDELSRSQDVILLLGFYHVENVDPVVNDFVVAWRRTGGHYVTVAGVDPANALVAISDPDADAAEEGGAGFIRGGDHNHDGDNDPGTALTFRDPGYDHTIHAVKDLASHDVYGVGPFSPGGALSALTVDGDPLAYADRLVPFHDGDAGGAFDVDSTFLTAAFLAENGYPIPEVCQTYTVVEAAVIVSPFDAILVDNAPANEESLWRAANNIVRLTFDGDVAWPFDGTLMIREMLSGGAFGPDVSNQFTFDVENDGGGNPRILKIREDGAVLAHRTWVAITYAGGTDIGPFELHYPVQVGDASNDNRVLSFDVSMINGGIPGLNAPDDDRRDINGDGRILSFDVSITNGSIPSLPVPKPSGH